MLRALIFQSVGNTAFYEYRVLLEDSCELFSAGKWQQWTQWLPSFFTSGVLEGSVAHTRTTSLG